MRWKSVCGGLALLLLAIAGCKQRCFLHECDFNEVQNNLPSNLDLDPKITDHPVIPPVGAPPSLWDLERKVRYLSLAEAVSIALEQGTVGQPSLLFPGIGLDNLVQFAGNGSQGFGGRVAGSDAIRVLAYEPAFQGIQIERALSKFDATFETSLVYSGIDQPGAQVLTGTLGTPLVQQQAVFNTLLTKPLPSGGLAGITFNTTYQYTSPQSTGTTPGLINPSYRPVLTFGFDQPLLQGFGVEINQLRGVHPSASSTSFLNQFGIPTTFQTILGGNPVPQGADEGGILITRLRFDQSRAEFERNVNQMLLNVEVAYWNLYGSYWTLYSREQGLRFAYEAWKLSRAGFLAGRVKAADYYQTLGQYELFRAQRLTAVDTVLDNERQLRALLGMPIEDCTRLVPSDSPTLAPFQPDWCSALEQALTRRPELYMARQDVKVNQLGLILTKNSLLPDLRFTASYDVNALGTRLDGSTPESAPNTGNALKNLASDHFNSYNLGLRLVVPIGYRAQYAGLRIARLRLEQSYEVLKDQELKAERFLGLQYRRISSFYEQIRAQRAQREAFGEQLRAADQEFRAGRITTDRLLEAQRFWADALANEYNAIVQYNNALVGFEFAKGSIMEHDNVVISEGPLPECAEVRAVEHQRERTAALVLRERALPVVPAAHHEGSDHLDPPAPPNGTPSLLSVWKNTPPLKDAPPLPADLPSQASGPLPQPVEANPAEVLTVPPAASGSSPAMRSPAAPGSSPAMLPPVSRGPGQPAVKGPSDFGTLKPADPAAVLSPPQRPTTLP